MAGYGTDGRNGENEEATQSVTPNGREWMEKILILGMGGHAKSLIDALEKEGKYEIAGYVVNDNPNSDFVKRYPVLGNDSDLQRLFQQGIPNAAIGIGFLGKSSLRNQLYEKLKEIGYQLPVICDPSAVLASGVTIGEGTFVGKGTILNTDATIGKMCIINTGAIVEHDCNVGDFSHISVGTVLCGEASVGSEAFIGANATVIQCCKIADGCIVGAGEVIRKNIGNG